MSSRTHKRILLPKFRLTEVCDADDPFAMRVDDALETYYVRPKKHGQGPNEIAEWARDRFNLYPVVVDSSGAPWAEAHVHFLNSLLDEYFPEMTTYAGLADDLSAFRSLLESIDTDWLDFPQQKRKRPTYRFRSHLVNAIKSTPVEGKKLASVTTASRRISSVVAFYRALIKEEVLILAHEPWKEGERFIDIPDRVGARRVKKVLTTDLIINVPKNDDPYTEFINDDGEKLRPLPTMEQDWLVDALMHLKNTEMTLIFMLAILTGARIQTALTLQVRHIKYAQTLSEENEILLPIGPGTSIDTKFDKKITLHIPDFFYDKLRTYCISERALRRRKRAPGGDVDSQYLFLSKQGNPLYQSKADLDIFNEGLTRRYPLQGQAVRTFIRERFKPQVEKANKIASFGFKFHDLRATAGMNWMDAQMKLVSQGVKSLHEACVYVQARMGHDKWETTLGYLNYRYNVATIRKVEAAHENRIRELTDRAMKGLL